MLALDEWTPRMTKAHSSSRYTQCASTSIASSRHLRSASTKTNCRHSITDGAQVSLMSKNPEPRQREMRSRALVWWDEQLVCWLGSRRRRASR